MLEYPNILIERSPWKILISSLGSEQHAKRIDSTVSLDQETITPIDWLRHNLDIPDTNEYNFWFSEAPKSNLYSEIHTLARTMTPQE